MTDNDSAWKEMLEKELPFALAFCFPEIHSHLDWTYQYEILEQELRALYPKGEMGKRIADCLIKAMSKEGDDRFMHCEVQGGVEADFPYRMHVYNYRAEDKFSQPVISFAILIDEDPKWQPDCYEAELYGSIRTLKYPIFKILEWRSKEAELRTHPNPVALFVLAQLASMDTKKDDAKRAEAKLDLIRLLRDRGMTEYDLFRWYRYLDWLLPLPKEYDDAILKQILQQQKEKTVPFISYAERVFTEKGMEKGMEKGLVRGRQQAIEAVLEVRFDDTGTSLVPRVQQVNDPERLQQLLQVVKTASLAEIEAALAAPTE